MNRLRILLLVAALGAALLAAYLAQGFLQPSSAPPPVAASAPPPSVDVLVAAKDLVQGQKLADFAVEWRAWPRDLVGTSMITKDAQPKALEDLKDARARLPIVTGEPVVEAKIVRPSDRSYMSAVLPKGMRAIAIGISEGSAASGFILPNDRVDVLLLRRSGDPGRGAETVMTNVRVLAINQTLNKGDDPALPGGRTAVLELEPHQAEILTQLQAVGGMSLVLRSLAEGGDDGIAEKPALTENYRNRGANDTLIIRGGEEAVIENSRIVADPATSTTQ
jgi:pilus assembly protein CpaB